MSSLSATLRSLAWKGIPQELRPMVWQLLLVSLTKGGSIISLYDSSFDFNSSSTSIVRSGISTSNSFRQIPDYSSKASWVCFCSPSRFREREVEPRPKYLASNQYRCPENQPWDSTVAERSYSEGEFQLEVNEFGNRDFDSSFYLFSFSLLLTQSLERILYVWALRHPASGYVQGINDLATPFFEVFLSAYISESQDFFEFRSPHLNLLRCWSPSCPALLAFLFSLWSRAVRHHASPIFGLGRLGSWHFLVSLKVVRRDPRQLHFRSAWNSKTSEKDGRAGS